MEKNKEFRELQFSSTQLVFVFLAILVLGVFIFLLGVSVGKKQGQLTAEAGLPGQLKTVKVAEKQIVPTEAGAADIQKELQSHKQAKQEAVKTGAPTEAKPESKQTVEPQKPSSKTETPPAKEKSGEAKAQTAAKKPVETKVKPETEKPAGKAADAKPNIQFFVQAGAFADKSAASTYANKLEKEAFPAFVMDPLATDSRAVFRVRIGPFGSRDDADASRTKLADSLKKKKTDFFIVR
jgi:cell division septation protein DedD